jgi:hypothetical protein
MIPVVNNIEVELRDGVIAAGGWSRGRTLYGGDQMKGVTDPLLKPATRRAFASPECKTGNVADCIEPQGQRSTDRPYSSQPVDLVKG